jgi:glycolate dehydrogenase FAD-binding subunit
MKQAMASVPSRLMDLVGAEHVLTGTAELAACEVDGLRPSAVVRAGSAAEVAAVLALAATERLAVIPMGGRSKLGIGMPPRQYDVALDLTRMDRVLAFDPADLTLGVEPGVRFAELEQQLAAKRQFLPLAPAFAARATLGGMIAAGADSPLRHAYGSARDQLLGMEFVTGAGVAAKSGGRVVKNVTGYDMHQLLAGSLGTLAVITRLNFRTFPLPPQERMFVAAFAGREAALEFCRAIGKSQLQPRLVEAFNPATAQVLRAARAPMDRWSVAVAVAGHGAVVARHEQDLSRMARELRADDFAAFDGAEQDALFAALREFPRLVLEASPGAAIFRLAILPGAMPELLRETQALGERHQTEMAILVRAAGIVYVALLPAAGDARSVAALPSACRDLMQAGLGAGARPMIEWCLTAVKREVNVWPPPGNDQALAEKLKRLFDPQGILAPGRFLGGL